MMAIEQDVDDNDNETQSKMCGIIMPISAIDDCSTDHWVQVCNIIKKAVKAAGLNGRMVNESDDVAIIHRNIVQNIYSNPMIVCDISHKNPNVMLELGMRLAFGKHVVIIKDDKTTIPFDTGVIETLTYPRDLRYPVIESFIPQLADKIKSTHHAAINNEKSTFLNQFSSIHVASIESKEVELSKFLDVKFQDLSKQIDTLNRDMIKVNRTLIPYKNSMLTERVIRDYITFCNENSLQEDHAKSVHDFARKVQLPDTYIEILRDRFISVRQKTILKNDDVPF